MLFVEYPKCTTCQRAKKFLDSRGAVYTDRHIKEENPTAEELRTWWKRSGLPLKKFFNTSGLQYKALGCPAWTRRNSSPCWPPTACWSSAPSWWGRTLSWWASGRTSGRSGFKRPAA